MGKLQEEIKQAIEEIKNATTNDGHLSTNELEILFLTTLLSEENEWK